MKVNATVTGLSACFLICLLARGRGVEGRVAATLAAPASGSPATIRIWVLGREDELRALCSAFLPSSRMTIG